MTSTRSLLGAAAAATAVAGALLVAPAQAADPTVQVVSSVEYVDAANLHHLVGEVQNGTASPVQLASVQVTFYDKANASLGSQKGSVALTTMDPGEKSPFDVVFSPPAGYDHSGSTAAGFAGTAANHNFTVSATRSYTDASGIPHVAGTVRNDNTTSASSVQVVGTLLDSAGKVTDVAVAYAVPATVPAGQTATFDLSGHAGRPFASQRLVAQSPTAPAPGASPSPSPTGGTTAPQPRSTTLACPTGRVPSAGFADVPAGGVHSGDIQCVVWWQVANGQTATTYGPSAAVRRDQMASFIARLIRDSGGTLAADAPDAFRDDDSDTHQADINALAQAGIVKGTSAGRFNPGGVVTRGAMAAFLVRAYDYRSAMTLAHATSYFADDDGTTFESDIDDAAAAGFAGGYTDGTYRPSGVVTRDQMATFLARVLDLVVADQLAAPPSA